MPDPENRALLSDHGYCPHCEEPLIKPPDERQKLIGLYNLLTDGTDPAGLVEDAIAYLREPVAETDLLVALLHECQSALTGPADLRQRIEVAVGPAPWREALNGGDS